VNRMRQARGSDIQSVEPNKCARRGPTRCRTYSVSYTGIPLNTAHDVARPLVECALSPSGACKSQRFSLKGRSPQNKELVTSPKGFSELFTSPGQVLVQSQEKGCFKQEKSHVHSIQRFERLLQNSLENNS